MVVLNHLRCRGGGLILSIIQLGNPSVPHYAAFYAFTFLSSSSFGTVVALLFGWFEFDVLCKVTPHMHQALRHLYLAYPASSSLPHQGA